MNSIDDDDDGDGIDSRYEATMSNPFSARGTRSRSDDFDGDGIVDSLDPDDENDGLLLNTRIQIQMEIEIQACT